MDILAKKEDKLKWLIEDLPLRKRVITPLLCEKLKYLGDVTVLSKRQVSSIPNYGIRCMTELSEFLWKHGLDFNQPPIPEQVGVDCHIAKDNADFYVEAYTVDCVRDELKKVRLAYIAGYRDHYDIPEEQQVLMWLELRDKVKEVYSKYQDGEVTVELVIKEDWVNV